MIVKPFAAHDVWGILKTQCVAVLDTRDSEIVLERFVRLA